MGSFIQKSCNSKSYMITYPYAALIRKAANVSINISAINLTSSDDRADNPMRQLKDDYCLKESAEIQRISHAVIYAFLIKELMLRYTQIENSLLQTIVRLAKEGRILMRKTKEKELNGTRQRNAASKVKRTDEHSKDDFIMLPTVDFCFKELMHNENVRKGIIAAILNVDPKEVEDTILMPTILRKESEDDKYGILDVKVKMKSGVLIDLEMQVVYYDCWEKRTIYYLSKMYTEQIKAGEDYDKLQKCIQVSILDHVLIQEDDKYYRCISFCDTETGERYSDMMEMHILELPKLPPEQKDETDLMQWMRFLGGKNREDLKRMAEKNSNLQEAYDELDRLSADERKRLEYDARQKAIRDKNIPFKTGVERGRKDIILSMLNAGMSIEQIAEITKEPVEDIKKLAKAEMP